MAEPYSKPNREQIKKLLSFVSDPIGYHLMACSIEAMNRIKPDEYNIQESQFGEWIFLTRRLLWKYGLYQIAEYVYHLFEQNADEYWNSFEPPKIEPNKPENVNMISKEWKSG